MTKYLVKMRFFAFTNDAETLMICFSKKEANEWLKIYKGCERYKNTELWIEKA